VATNSGRGTETCFLLLSSLDRNKTCFVSKYLFFGLGWARDVNGLLKTGPRALPF
jgi:hypothetical protein